MVIPKDTKQQISVTADTRTVRVFSGKRVSRESERRVIGVCGDVCSECPRYIATLRNDDTALIAVAQLWYRAGFRDRIVSIEEIRCTGCSKTKTCVHEINLCVYLEGKDTCGECDRFPCEKLEEVIRRSERFKDTCQRNCSPEEFLQLHRAFFQKQDILQEIHRNKKP